MAKKTLSSGILSVSLLAILFLPFIFASGAELVNPIRFGSLRALVSAVIDVVIQIAVPIAALFLIYSGYLFVSARGSDEDIKKAKSIFTWTLVGIAVLLGAEVLSRVIEGTIAQIKR